MKKVIICILCLMLLCGCSGVKTDVTQNRKKITVVATIFPLYDFARAIGGDLINLKMLIRPGTEVHSFEPLPSDMTAVYDSDLFLYIGGESDTWVDTLLADSYVKSLALIDGVSLVCEAEHEHKHTHLDGHTHTDEHIWTSPKTAVSMLENICQIICDIDPENADIYTENCNLYIKKIKDASDKIDSVVEGQAEPFILVADRFPFEYFTEQYGIEYEAAFGGCAVSTDISLKTMARLTKTIESKNVKNVFCTELSNQNIAKALKELLNVEIIELHSAHNVTLDDFNEGITYVDILYRNAKALERGFNP